jgi:prepilin-type processing-associated H-X9-DG protein
MKSDSSLNSEAAFTITELCVVLGCVAVLALLLLPAFGQSKVNSQALQCMENTRRLTLAWRMYAEDNSDRIVYSSDDGDGNAYSTTVSGNSNHQGDLYAWTWSKMDFNGGNGFNWDTNADITLRPLWPYIKNAAVYKCPADTSQVTITSLPGGYAGPYTVGSVVPRIRSYSMNYYLGGLGDNGTITLPGAGSWASHFPVYTKLTDLNLGKSPGPNQTFIFIDERSDIINWGNFATDFSGYPLTAGAKPSVAQYQWNEDLPSSYHDFAAGISFADGHAELHRWLDPRTSPPLGISQLVGGAGSVFSAPNSQDVAWMQSVSARPH